ncbi:MAG: PA2169 family four-helix-bundle protein [Planctomycetota bacterium]
MSIKSAETIQNMTDENVGHVQELIRGLRDSIEYHHEAAEKVEDDNVKQLFTEIVNERKTIVDTLSGMVAMNDESPVDDGSWLGTMRKCWTTFRAGLNAGDPTVILIEAERAEDTIMAKFKSVLPKAAGSQINDVLLQYFEKVKSGHDRVLALRNAYQAA